MCYSVTLCKKINRGKVVKKLSKSYQVVVKKLSKSCQKVVKKLPKLSKSCLELGVNRKLLTMCYFLIKSGEGGEAGGPGGVGGQKVVPRS
jgi:hypothetical protein